MIRYSNLALCLLLGATMVRSQIVSETGLASTHQKTALTPADQMQAGDVAQRVTASADLWVDAASGDDDQDGLTLATAFRSVQRAADVAGPGAVVHILPGIYRETMRPARSGIAGEPVVYRAENGPGTVLIRGSQSAAALTWNRLVTNTIGLPPSVDPGNLYYADLSPWQLDGPPRFVVQLDEGGGVIDRLPLAREPDWQVDTEWKHGEFWWAAEGGSEATTCDPATDSDSYCDEPSQSAEQLTDGTDDVEPAGIEAGNLTTLGDLTGATLTAMDTVSGHYIYRRTIIDHEVAAGRVTVDEPCTHESNPGLGWASKYFVEGLPSLLDSPGEWWYDEDSGRLYLWPPTDDDPATMSIEISRRETAFDLSDRSFITLDGLTAEFFDGSALYQSNNPDDSSYYNTVRNATIRYASIGLDLYQSANGPASNLTDHFTLVNSEIAYMDSLAIYLDYWWSGGEADAFTHAGIVNTVILNNELHHLGFRSDFDDGVGGRFIYAHRLRFEGNYVHHVAHNGMQFSKSVVQSADEWGFSPDEIKTGEILIKDNVFEKACLLEADCGALKIWGSAPDNHVFRDMLITGNVFRDTIGWTYVSEKRGRWSGGAGSNVLGMGGFGLYLDYASGIHAYRNIAYNNASSGYNLYGAWSDGDIVFYNNIAANSLYGIRLGRGADYGSVRSHFVNNILINNEAYGILIANAQDDYGNFQMDHNLYFRNGWLAREDGGAVEPGAMAVEPISGPAHYYQTLAEIRANTPWEDYGVAENPGFVSYDPDDNDIFDASWPDFHTTPLSAGVLDRGTIALPATLEQLLFGLGDSRLGSAYDIGRYEAAGAIATPVVRILPWGATTGFLIRSYPPSFPADLHVTVNCPEPDLRCTLSSAIVGPGQTATLTVQDTHDPVTPSALPAWYTISISATFAGGSQETPVRVFVGGRALYLPLVY